MDFCRRRQNKLKLIQKYMDFCRRRQNKGEENTKNMDFCRQRQKKGEENAKNMDFCRRRQNKDEAFVFEKSMIYDDMTIYIHEIDMLNRFLNCKKSANFFFEI